MSLGQRCLSPVHVGGPCADPLQYQVSPQRTTAFLGEAMGASRGARVALQAAAGAQLWTGLAGESLTTKPMEPALSKSSLKSA